MASIVNRGQLVEIDYTNYKGARRKRIIAPIDGSLRFTETPHHKPAQWVFDAYDFEKTATRTFALASVHETKIVPADAPTPGPRLDPEKAS